LLSKAFCVVENRSAVMMKAQSSLLIDDKFGSWLRHARSLAQQSGADVLDGEIKKLEERRQKPGFRIGVVGEFNTGKSTLIGGLLGNWDLLPTGDAPTTATIVTVAPGNESFLEISRPDIGIERRPLERSSWSDLLPDERTYSREVTATARVVIDCQWLREVDIELVDTPGVAGLGEHKLILTLQALAECDAALVTVAATKPFSLTERKFPSSTCCWPILRSSAEICRRARASSSSEVCRASLSGCFSAAAGRSS
jgi:ribosome biogenesis GTPase A